MTVKEEIFGIASFRSRQQVLALASALHRAGIGASIVTTPRSVALGCGLSVRFALEEEGAVREIYRRARPGNLIGFYQVRRLPGGDSEVTPLAGAR